MSWCFRLLVFLAFIAGMSLVGTLSEERPPESQEIHSEMHSNLPSLARMNFTTPCQQRCTFACFDTFELRCSESLRKKYHFAALHKLTVIAQEQWSIHLSRHLAIDRFLQVPLPMDLLDPTEPTAPCTDRAIEKHSCYR